MCCRLGGAFGIRLTRRSLSAMGSGLVSRWVGSCATRSHAAVRTAGPGGAGPRWAGRWAARLHAALAAHSQLSGPGRRSALAESSVPAGLGDRPGRSARTRDTEDPGEPGPCAGSCPAEAPGVPGPTRTPAALPAARGRAAMGLRELPHPCNGDPGVRSAGWVEGGGKSVTRSAHRAFCPAPSKEHPGRGAGYSLPTRAGADRLSLLLLRRTRRLAPPPRVVE